MVDTSAGLLRTRNNEQPPLGEGTQLVGSLQTYTLSGNGHLTPVSNAASGGRAACWVALTKNGRYAFVTNTLSATATNPAPGNPIGTGQAGLSRYSVSPSGALRLLGTVNTGPGTPSDVELSPDGRFLYMANPTQGVLPGGLKSHVEVYRIGPGGSLTMVQATPPALAIGLSGMAVS
jgi:6-phosphogluconolactonase (cycloisomerase 2 family)